MYVCIYACMYVCMYVCMYACTYVRMYVYMYACMYIRTYVCMYVIGICDSVHFVSCITVMKLIDTILYHNTVQIKQHSLTQNG